MKSVYGSMNTYERLGRAHQLSGEYEGALSAYSEGLHLAREERVYMREADFLLSIAEVQKLQEDYHAFETTLLAIPEVANRINYQTILPKVYDALYNHYRKIGDFEKALNYLEKLDHALDQVESRTAAVELAEAEAKLNQIVQQKELASEMGKRERITLIAASVVLLLLIVMTFGAIVYRKNRNLKKVNDLIEQQKKEIQKQNDALEKALKKAESSVLAKGQFLSRMSHEIRTPMNAIVGLTDVILH
ncbi:MAG: hypothetical protein J4F31_09560 [Flavobacteriales bacterium]|nr:hypothetical protein [Flavobacteriales bacterium]